MINLTNTIIKIFIYRMKSILLEVHMEHNDFDKLNPFQQLWKSYFFSKNILFYLELVKDRSAKI